MMANRSHAASTREASNRCVNDKPRAANHAENRSTFSNSTNTASSDNPSNNAASTGSPTPHSGGASSTAHDTTHTSEHPSR